MGILTRVRDWFARVLGGAESGDPEAPSGQDTDPTESDDTTEDDDHTTENEGLDPAAVSETRSEATDDAVAALRTVRESGSANGSDGDETTDDDGQGRETSADAVPADEDGPDQSETER